MLSQRILECEANVALLHSFLESRSALARHLESHELPRTIEPGLNTARDPSQSLLSLYSNRKTRIRKWTNIIKRVKVYQTINKNLVDTTTAKQQIVFCHGKNNSSAISRWPFEVAARHRWPKLWSQKTSVPRFVYRTASSVIQGQIVGSRDV